MSKQTHKADIVSVAKLAGVSPATVSRALNHPDLVNPATRKKIDAAIRKSGYIRNRAAQMMHGRRSATIGIIVPTVSYAIFAEVVQAFNETVSDQGFTLLLSSHGYDLGTEYVVLRKLLEHRIDGVALIGLDHSPDTIRLLQEQEVPMVAIWNYSDDFPFSCIGAENAEAGRCAAEHLAMLGHRRIGQVFPPVSDNDRARARLKAVRSVFDQNGVISEPRWSAETRYSLSEAKAACLRILSQEDRPTALLCGNDIIAHGAIYAAMKLGLSIPNDLSVVGIGDFAGSAEMEPALTTVRLPARKIGKAAGAHLVEAIARRDTNFIERIRFDVELMMRKSSAPVYYPPTGPDR
ncbi:LacI family DNA-binding transcriptional regulator [Amaricoccus macauensis]|uniref:LacI family DNA-binding transcriptional regulator n=1 Tax=Amaricoccus macauensis TaxID=57001 RepID=UPI003C7DDA6E